MSTVLSVQIFLEIKNENKLDELCILKSINLILGTLLDDNNELFQ